MGKNSQMLLLVLAMLITTSVSARETGKSMTEGYNLFLINYDSLLCGVNATTMCEPIHLGEEATPSLEKMKLACSALQNQIKANCYCQKHLVPSDGPKEYFEAPIFSGFLVHATANTETLSIFFNANGETDSKGQTLSCTNLK